MDPVSLACAVAALLQLSDYGMKVTSRFYNHALTAGAARGDIEYLGSKIHTFSCLVKAAQMTLKEHRDKHPKSHVIRYLRKHQVIRTIKHTSDRLRKRLKTWSEELESLKSSSPLWMTIKWIFNRSRMMELLPDLDSFQADLSLLLAVCQMEALNKMLTDGVSLSSKERRRLEEELYVLRITPTAVPVCADNVCASYTVRRSLKHFIRIVEHLHGRVSEIENELKHDHPSFGRVPDMQEILITLGRTMYKVSTEARLSSSLISQQSSECLSKDPAPTYHCSIHIMTG
jgi:hypothetical protein